MALDDEPDRWHREDKVRDREDKVRDLGLEELFRTNPVVFQGLLHYLDYGQPLDEVLAIIVKGMADRQKQLEADTLAMAEAGYVVRDGRVEGPSWLRHISVKGLENQPTDEPSSRSDREPHRQLDGSASTEGDS